MGSEVGGEGEGGGGKTDFEEGSRASEESGYDLLARPANTLNARALGRRLAQRSRISGGHFGYWCGECRGKI